MTAFSEMDAVIRRVVKLGDYVRRPGRRLMDRGDHKEWFHFSICSSELDAIVNFNVTDAHEESEAVAQLTCAVRSDGWHGDIDQFAAPEIFARSGRHRVRLGQSCMQFADGHYRLTARLRERALGVDLVLYPVTMPSQVNNIDLGAEPSLHWFLVPRLLAFGHVTIEGRAVEVHAAHAYHDHNWGYFRWGGDFSWIWGYGHGRGVGSPWSIAFDRLSNRARTIDLERGLLLWKGNERRKLFRGRDLQVVESGTLRPSSRLSLPRPLALTRPALAAEVPARLVGRAEHGKDLLEFEFEGRHLCQLLVPNDDDLETTVINEVTGSLRMTGVVCSERVEFEGYAMFEFLGD
jgi:hypothetical protein